MKLVKTYGYTLLHNTRKNRAKEIGRGVGFLLKLGIKYMHINYKKFSSFELFEMLASSNESMLLAGDMYIHWEKD